MKKLMTLAAFTFLSFAMQAQSAIGTWKTIDDEDGKVKSHVEIYETNGKIEGKIVKLIDPIGTECIKCKGDRKDRPILGMVIIWDMENSDDGEWDGGTILDPKSGKEYKCKIGLENEKTLEVRGYLGFSLFGRSQTWYKVEAN